MIYLHEHFIYKLQIMPWLCIKGRLLTSSHYISKVKVGGTCGFCVMMLNITGIVYNNVWYSNTVYMLFYKRSTRWKHLRGIGLAPMDAACWVSWAEGIETPYSTCSSWTPLSTAYFHSLLLFFWFIGLDSLVSSWFLCLLMSIRFCLFWTYICNMQWWTCFLYVCILCGLLPCGSSPMFTFTLLDDSECPWPMHCLYYRKLFFHVVHI